MTSIRSPLAFLATIAMLLMWGRPVAAAPPAPAKLGDIAIVAGRGRPAGFGGDHGPATAARLSFPIDVARVAAAQGGGFLIADEGNDRIRRVTGTGVITTVAGDGRVCHGFKPNDPTDPCGDTGPATSASLHQPTGVVALPGGGFLVADRGDGVIRKVDAHGVITTVAGNGRSCAPVVAVDCGDDGRALDASLDAPDRVALLPGGGFLVTEDQGNRVRLVTRAGDISTVAGSPAGDACPSSTSPCGDGGPATAALLHAPNGIATLRGGGFVITDSEDNRVRRIDANGRITTVAGSGVAGSFGNHVRATEANLNSPSDVVVAGDGSIVIADTFSQLVRVVRRGVIRTIAGEPDRAGDGPDGGPGTRCRLHLPYGLGITAGGDVVVADHANQRIRRIDTDLRGAPG